MKRSNVFRLLCAVFLMVLFQGISFGQQNHCLKIESAYKVEYVWDNAFFIKFIEPLPNGIAFSLRMDIKADKNSNQIITQQHSSPWSYLSYNSVGVPLFDTEWSTFTFDGVSSGDGFQTIMLCLSTFPEANSYYFDNISVVVDSKEYVLNGDFEGDDLSSFVYSYNQNPILQVTSDMVVVSDMKLPTSIDLTNVQKSYDLFDNLSGTFTAIFNDETTKEYPISIARTTFDNTKYGEQTITVSYHGASAETKVNVNVPYATFNDGTLSFFYGYTKPEDAFVINSYDLQAWLNLADQITNVVFDESFYNYKPYKIFGWFYDCKNLHTIDLSGLNTQNLYSVSHMFSNCNNLRTIFVDDNWNASTIADGYTNFNGCPHLYGGLGTKCNERRDYIDQDISFLHIDGGEDNPGYFTRKGDDVYIPTEAYVVQNEGTLTFFYKKNILTDFVLVEELLNREFYDYPENLGIINVSKVVFDESFLGCTLTNCHGLFANFINLTEIVGMKDYLVTDEVSDMGYMFLNCSKLKNIDLSNFVTDNVQYMPYMFSNTTIETIDMSSFNTPKVTNRSYMFNSCPNLKTIIVGGGWTIDNEAYQNIMFSDCRSLSGGQGTIFNDANNKINYARIDGGESAPGYFTQKGAEKLQPLSIEVTKLPTKTEYFLGDCDLNLEGGEVTVYFDGYVQTQKLAYTNVTLNTTTVGKHSLTVEYLGKTTTYDINVSDPGIREYTLFDEETGTLTLYYGKYRDGAVLGISTVEDLRLKVKKAVIDPSYKNFEPISTANMFMGYNNMTEIIGLEYLNTTKVTDMSQMFCYCYNLADIDLSHFNTDNVTNMERMFQLGENTVLTTLDLSSFNTKNVEQIGGMFWGAQGLKTIYVSDKFDVELAFQKQSEFMNNNLFGYCFSLVGGAGSQCSGDWSMSSLLFAHIDMQYNTWQDGRGFFTKIPDVVSIEIVSMPDKIEYYEGEPLNLDGCKVKVKYDADDFECVMPITAADVSGYDPTNPIKQTLTINYRGATATFDIDVIHRDAYVVLDNSTLTFYYDENKPTVGQVFSIDLNNNWNNMPWSFKEYNTVVIDKSFKDCKPTSTAFWFYGLYNLEEIKGLEYLNTENVNNMNGMFMGCQQLSILDLSNFDTRKVQNFRNLFADNFSLTTIYVGDNWCTPLNLDNYVFMNCNSLMGGEGTVYNHSILQDGSHSYACIDGGDDNPGLFTRKLTTKPIATNIEITTQPNHTYYFIKEPLDIYDIELTVTLSNGRKVKTGIFESNVLNFDNTKSGNRQLIISKYGVSTELEVTVSEIGPYAKLDINDGDSTLIFYYGKYQSGDYPIPYYTDYELNSHTIHHVIIDESIANYRPTS